MVTNPLSNSEIETSLGRLDGWSFDADSLKKTFEFSSFREAVSFIVRVAFEAEELNHHPEIENVYNRVAITLRTHDAGNKVTRADLNLAAAIESFSWV